MANELASMINAVRQVEQPHLTFKATLSITTDLDSLHCSEEKRGVWVAVQVRGEVINHSESEVRPQCVPANAPSLAIAVVLDNS